MFCSCRRQGIGSALFSLLLSNLKQREVGYLILSAPNDAAIKFFEKFTFEKATDDESFGLEATWDSYSSLV